MPLAVSGEMAPEASIGTMNDIEEIRSALSCGRGGCSCKRGVNTHCPVPSHEDRTPSLSMVVRNGVILYHCHGGCSQDAVTAALRAKFDTEPVQDTGRKQVALYGYRDAAGTLIAEKARFEYPNGKKSFQWRLPGKNFQGGLAPLRIADIPLWGTELIVTRTTESVWYVEGEKAAESCRSRGLLAVTHGGGASTIDFGTSLDVLVGRNVILWPDNDAPGRTYMARVQALLRNAASSIQVINVPLEEGGDAWDYFTAGGTVDELNIEIPLLEPAVDFLSEDSMRVRLPSPQGGVSFTFDQMEGGTRSIDTELTILLEGAGTSVDTYSERINVLSSSAKTELRRSLENVYGKEYGWTALVNRAMNIVRERFMSMDRAVDAFELEYDEDAAFLVDTILPELQPVVMFGAGSAGKSFTSLSLCLAIAMGLSWCGMPVQKGRVLWIDYEDSPRKFRFRLNRVCAGLGMELLPDMIHRWDPKGVPLHEQVPALKRKITKEGITLVVIDSAALACGGEPEKAEMALRYFAALSKLSVTSLTIAHITGDAQENKRMAERPFGSVFWHNLARRTWYVARFQEENSDDIEIGLYCKKVNDGRLPAPVGLKVKFQGANGPVFVERIQMKDSADLQSRRDVKHQVWDVLEGAMTVAEIAAASSVPQDSVKKAIQRNPGMFVGVDEVSSEGGRPSIRYGRRAR